MTTTRHGSAAIAAVLSLLIAAGGFAFAVAAQKNDSVGYRDSIVVQPDETRNNVVGFGGDIDVRGKVRKSVLSFGGTITVGGEVGEAVVGFGARIVLNDTAVVHGDLVALGGSVEKAPGARVEGDTVNFRAGEIFSKVFGEGFRGLFGISLLPLILVFKVVNLMLWILVGVIAASVYPKQVAFAADQIRKAPGPTLAYGLAAQFLFVFAIIVASVLCLVLIGIPLLMGLAAGGFLVKAFGRVAVFVLLGASLSRALGKGTITPVGAAVLGAVVIGLIGFVPILGFLIVGVLSLFGWGTAVRTKFGTMENWLQKKPFPPAAPPTA